MTRAAARYDVFIRYSHQDKPFAVRLEKALRRYRPPLGSGLTPRCLAVFRDESEAATTRLSEALDASLAASRRLLLVCTPAARASRWANEEIARFSAVHGIDNAIPLLRAGLPHDQAVALGQPEANAFPDALVNAGPSVPWSPDFRSAHGRRIAATWPGWFHLLAAIYAVLREQIEGREKRRRIYRLAAAVAAAAALVSAGLLHQQQRQLTASTELAAQADALSGRHTLPTALRLAVEAVDAAPTPRAIAALKTKLVDNAWDTSGSEPTRVAFSADGRRLALASPLVSTVIDLTNGYSVALCGFVNPVTTLAFSPDGRWLLAASGHDRQVRVFDAVSARQRGAIDGSLVSLQAHFAPDSTALVLTGLKADEGLLASVPELTPRALQAWRAGASRVRPRRPSFRGLRRSRRASRPCAIPRVARRSGKPPRTKAMPSSASVKMEPG